MKELTGRHVFAMFGLGFGTIIAVNAALAINAVRSFPGLEVQNSYVASQTFDQTRRAQQALNWDVSVVLEGTTLTLRFTEDGAAIAPQITDAVFGRATSMVQDQIPDFRYENGDYTATVAAGPGNWNLRLSALSENGTPFQQRLVVEVRP